MSWYESECSTTSIQGARLWSVDVYCARGVHVTCFISSLLYKLTNAASQDLNKLWDNKNERGARGSEIFDCLGSAEHKPMR